jgi:hypothetical protein
MDTLWPLNEVDLGSNQGWYFSKTAGAEARAKLRLRSPAHDGLAARHFSAEMSAFDLHSTSIGGAFL